MCLKLDDCQRQPEACGVPIHDASNTVAVRICDITNPYICAVVLSKKVLSPNVSARLVATTIAAPPHATCVASCQQFHRRSSLCIQQNVLETTEPDANLWIL